MSKDNIIQIICEIMKEKIHIPQELIVPENYDKPLTGMIMKLDEYNLLYLFFEIEKKFQIRIPEDQLSDYQFNTMNGVVDVIASCLA